MQEFYSSIQATSWGDLPSASVVYHSTQVPKTIYIHLPSTITTMQFVLDSIRSTNTKDTLIDLPTRVNYDAIHPWIMIESAALNLEQGYHLYCIEFKNPDATLDPIRMYISYWIVVDITIPNYKYMK